MPPLPLQITHTPPAIRFCAEDCSQRRHFFFATPRREPAPSESNTPRHSCRRVQARCICRFSPLRHCFRRCDAAAAAVSPLFCRVFSPLMTALRFSLLM